MNEDKQATEFTPEDIQADVELTDEELDNVAGGSRIVLFSNTDIFDELDIKELAANTAPPIDPPNGNS